MSKLPKDPIDNDKQREPFGLWNSIKTSLKSSWQSIKEHPWRSLAVAAAVVGVSLASGGVGAIAIGSAAAAIFTTKTIMDVTNDYAKANPTGKVAKFVDATKNAWQKITKPLAPIVNVAKSVGNSLKSIATTIKNNPWKSLAVAGAGVALIAFTGGAATPFVLAVAGIAVTGKIIKDLVGNKQQIVTKTTSSNIPNKQEQGKGLKKNPTIVQPQKPIIPGKTPNNDKLSRDRSNSI